VSAVIAKRGAHADRRFVEFFAASIRNLNTRKAYYRATSEFFDWCDRSGLGLLDIEPVHVAAWVESLRRGLAPPTLNCGAIFCSNRRGDTARQLRRID
jgi:hypothetical protein